MIMAAKELKRKLRQEMANRLRRLSNEEIETQSRLISDKLFQTEEFQTSKRVGLFLSMANEVNTITILKRSLKDGKQCFIPCYTPKSSHMKMVQLYSMEDYESLPLEPRWQIKQPDWNDHSRADCLKTGGLDLCLVPGVAFTKHGLRLGHGKGYYDRWLSECLNLARCPNSSNKCATKMPYTIGLALREQIVEDLPVTEFDVRLNHVIYP